MTDTKRWLEELPHGAPERDLLLAGRAARPPLGSVDKGWQALGVALGVTTVTTTAAAANGAIHAAGTATAGAASHTATTGAFAVAVKWFVAGVALGCGVSGAATVVERIGHGHPVHASPRLASVAPEHGAARAGLSRDHATPLTAPPEVAGEPVPAADAARAHESSTLPSSSAPRRELVAARQPASGPLEASPALPSQELALAAQARDLAEVKRLIDAGAAAAALARLEAGSRGGEALVLSEERDALYVQALASARRRTEARARARAFLARYPESPYLAAMRGLLTNE